MPHKHKRKADGDDSQYDLPPSIRAAPLPVGKGRSANPAPRNKKRKIANVDGYGQDDTPKAFARLMAFKATGKRRNGLDNGATTAKSKKQKQKNTEPVAGNDDVPNSEAQPQTAAVPTIQPGEKLSDFSARVNQALPLAGISKAGKKIAGVSDHRVTRHEKKLKRLQDGWRKEEARIRDKEQEELELAEEDQDEIDAMWEDKTADLPATGATANGKKGKKKSKRKLVVGEVDHHSEDEWEALKKKREARKGLHDVVHAPPQFDRVPREIFKVKNGAKVNVDNVPNAVGSLRKREEVAEERLTIIDTYRKLMASKRDG